MLLKNIVNENINDNNTRVIPLQDNSSLDIKSIKSNNHKRKIATKKC